MIASIPSGENIDGIAAGAYQAQYMARTWWQGCWILGLLNGFWILFSTHLGNTDILVRTITDIIWVASDKARATRRLNVAKVYYLLLAAFTAWGVIVMRMGKAADLFKILAAIAGVVLVPSAIQILIVNTRLLPRELRPSGWRRGALVCCSLFYAAVCLLVLWDKLQPQ